MSEQLEFLVTVSRHRQVTLQVIPFEAGPHRGQLGSFQWLGFPRPDDPGVVYVENQKGGLYLEESHEITGFHEEFAQLEQRALSPAESTKFLTKLVGDTA